MTKEQIKGYEIQLKPCPFCGSKDVKIRRPTFSEGLFFIQCENQECEVIVETLTRALDHAVEVWNKRGGEE